MGKRGLVVCVCKATMFSHQEVRHDGLMMAPGVVLPSFLSRRCELTFSSAASLEWACNRTEAKVIVF
jgi:hypothetical protein